MTLAELRQAVELLPEGASITLTVAELREALANGNVPNGPAPHDEPDRLLTAGQVADRLGVSRRYVYEHADTLPFTRRLDGVVRFSEQGLARWLARHL